MSSFAKKLKYYVEKSGQTIYSVSVTSGVERTMVHKMIKGDRIPSNKDIVLAIVEEEMQNAIALSVPLIADYGWGVNWLEAH